MNDHDRQNGRPAEGGSVLWAWVAEAQGEHGVARLRKAWLLLGTINLVGFSREVMTDPRLVEALQQQADQDGQTVRLVKFARAEEVLQVRPCPRQGDSGGGPQVPPS
jgi:hypothetical protein